MGSGKSIWGGDVASRQVTVTGVQIDQEEPPDHIASVLDAKLTLVRRHVYAVDGRPVQLATSYYPAELVSGSRIADPDTGPGGAYARLAGKRWRTSGPLLRDQAVQEGLEVGGQQLPHERGRDPSLLVDHERRWHDRARVALQREQ